MYILVSEIFAHEKVTNTNFELNIHLCVCLALIQETKNQSTPIL